MGKGIPHLFQKFSRRYHTGHSHDRRATDVGGIHISQNAKSLRYVTVADLTVRGGRIVSVDYEQLPVSEFEPDPEYVEAVARIRAAMPEMFDTVGRAEYEATKDGVANLFVEALAGHDYDGFRPEVTVYHFGGVRIGGIPAGDIPRWLIYDSDIFRSTVFIGEMTRSELECLVKTKYNSQGADGGKDKESHYVYLRSDVPYRMTRCRVAMRSGWYSRRSTTAASIAWRCATMSPRSMSTITRG